MKSIQLLVAVLAFSLAGCALIGKRKAAPAEPALNSRTRVVFVEKLDPHYTRPSSWQAKGTRKARQQAYDRAKDLTGLALAQSLADSGGQQIALALERLRNLRLEREQLEAASLPPDEKDRKLAAMRATEERTSRRIEEIALEMKLALYSSLLS